MTTFDMGIAALGRWSIRFLGGRAQGQTIGQQGWRARDPKAGKWRIINCRICTSYCVDTCFPAFGMVRVVCETGVTEF